MHDINENTSFDDISDILLEVSLSNLKNNVLRNFGKSREVASDRVRVVNYQILPSIQDKSLLLKSNIMSNGSRYTVQIRFLNVNYVDVQDSGSVELYAIDGQKYYIKPFTSAQKQVRVGCNCLDFYYRFSLWNHTKKSLEGPPPQPYIKKTDMPLVNPQEIPGVCKHIVKMTSFLKDEGIVR